MTQTCIDIGNFVIGLRICVAVNVITGEGNGNPLSTLAWKIPWVEEHGGLQSM